MPKVKQKWEEGYCVPIPHEDKTLPTCSENYDQWEKNIKRCECVACLDFLMSLGRWAETRFYAM